MEKELIKVDVEGKEEFVIDSREIAEMMDKTHAEILRYLEGYDKKNIIGIIPTLQVGDIPVDKYFIE